MCWDIRDPSSNQIWEDPWIPTLFWLKPMGPRPSTENVEKVSDLLLPNSRLWNLNLLNKMFLLEEVKEIQKIQFRKNGINQNQIICLREKNGNFSVKSAYNWFQNNEFQYKINLPTKGPWTKI